MKYGKITPEEAARLARMDKFRILGLTVSAVLIGALYLYSHARTLAEQEKLKNEAAEEAVEPEGVVQRIPFDQPEILAQIEDATETQQEFLKSTPLQEVFSYARLQTRKALESAGMRTLDAELTGELMADPAAHRLEPVLLRGQILDVSQRQSSGGERPGWMGSVLTDDGSLGYFFVANAPKLQGAPDAPQSLRRGDFVRIDGLFHKIYRAPVPDAIGSEALQSASGPLILGYGASPSTPAVPDADEITEEWSRALLLGLDSVIDDEIARTFEEDAFDLQQWGLLAYAKLKGGETDWDAAAELNQEVLTKIYEDGDEFRGTPFRIPVSINLDTYSTTVEDNPLRLERVTRGWIGNNNWKGAVKTIKWVGPFVRRDLVREQGLKGADDAHRYVEAKGYFFRNILFTNKAGEPRRSPVFVLHDLEVFQLKGSNPVAPIAMIVVGATFFMVIAIFLLLRADRRKSERLRVDMVRRRRKREGREAGAV
jgi:hypothetical protein